MKSFFKKNTKLESEVLPKDRLSEKETRFLYYASLIFLALVVIGGGVSQCTHHASLIKMGYYKEEPNLPPMEGYARYEIAGYKFKIPIRYLFRVYQIRGNRWIDDSAEQKIEGGIIFDFFMPELKSADFEIVTISRHELAKRGVHVMLDTRTEAMYSVKKILEIRQGRIKEIESNVAGLRKYINLHSKGNSDIERYFSQMPEKDSHFWMACDISCRGRVSYHEYPGLMLSFSYSAKYIEKWGVINEKIKSLLKEFLVSRPVTP